MTRNGRSLLLFGVCISDYFVNSMIHRYIVSDCNAVPIIYQQQGYAQTPEDAVADVLNAGKPKPIYCFC